MKVLITGATGRLGRELAARAPENADIEALIEPTDQSVPDSKWFRADITEPDRLLMAVTCSEPDIIIHLAAMTNVDGCERDPEAANRINRDGSANIARAAVECGAGLLYVSTDYVFDGRHGPYTEDDEPNPICEYGRSKLEGEQVVSSIVDGSTIIRISVPFGTRRQGTGHNYVSWLIEEFSAGNTLRIVDDQYTTPSYLPELADVLWILADKRVPGVVHYGTGDRLSRYEMALIVCEVMGYSGDFIEPVKTADMGFTAPRPLESGFVTDKILEITGTTPILYRNALYRMIEETG